MKIGLHVANEIHYPGINYKNSRVRIDPIWVPGGQTHFWVSLTGIRVNGNREYVCPGIRVKIPAFNQISGHNDTDSGSYCHGFRVKQTQKWVWPPGTQIRVISDSRVFEV